MRAITVETVTYADGSSFILDGRKSTVFKL